MVGTIKTALHKTLGRSLVSYEELRTILTELPAVVNERPLTYPGQESDEPRPITPGDFLRGGPRNPALFHNATRQNNNHAITHQKG